MKREKKIGFNYSLYKKYKDISGLELYPLYVTITYNRKSTNFPLLINDRYQDSISQLTTEEAFDADKYDKKFRDKAQNIIEKIVRYEIKLVGEKYLIKGIKSRFDKYLKPLWRDINETLDTRLNEILGDYLTYNEYCERNRLYDIEELDYDSTDFFYRYNHFTKNVDMMSKISKNDKDLIYSFIDFYLFNDYYFMNRLSVFEYHICLYDWLLDSDTKIMFKKFMTSDLRYNAIKALSKEDKNFKKFYAQFNTESSISNDFDKVFLIVDKLILESEINRGIKNDLELK